MGNACVAKECDESSPTDGSPVDSCCQQHDRCCGSSDRSPCNQALFECVGNAPASAPLCSSPSGKDWSTEIIAYMGYASWKCCGDVCSGYELEMRANRTAL